jgi:hypothetical protein
MRHILLAAAALLPAPALAQEAGQAVGSDAARLAEELRDPARQQQMAAMAQAMTGALLEMPAAPLLRAAREMAGEDPEAIDPDLRIGDVVDPRTAAAPEAFAAQLPRMMSAMAGFAGALEGMLPRLAEVGARMRRDGPERE